MELILVVNCGSSSAKCALFEGEKLEPVWYNELERHEGGLEALLATQKGKKLTAIGHRVVLGGEEFHRATPITAQVKEKIGDLSRLAPLHNPHNLEGIEIAEQLFPAVPQFAVFDTAFHATLSEAIATYPLPYHWCTKGIRRYGFHGISYTYCSKRAAQMLGREGKIILCHLGSGASLCAVEGGKSHHTTMGMTPLEGLMMGTRAGSVDPGVLVHLLREEGVSLEQLDQMLNHESGLLGISGSSDDVRDLLSSAAKGEKRAKLALEMFVERLAENIGMLMASLGGCDALVFTAGIGENAAEIREQACARFAFLGLKLDLEKNRSPSHEEREISQPDSKIKVFVIPTQEEWEIGKQIRDQLS